MKRYQNVQFDHTQVMGIGMAWIYVTLWAIALTGVLAQFNLWFLLIFPTMQVLFCGSVWYDVTREVDDV
jgi:hypothetical protein